MPSSLDLLFSNTLTYTDDDNASMPVSSLAAIFEQATLERHTTPKNKPCEKSYHQYIYIYIYNESTSVQVTCSSIAATFGTIRVAYRSGIIQRRGAMHMWWIDGIGRDSWNSGGHYRHQVRRNIRMRGAIHRWCPDGIRRGSWEC